jgi:nucleoside-diphosphate-sugar epimerase
MRVFVTGASGFIGSAVIPELLAGGHQVVGLARSDAAAERVNAAGAGVLRGDLDDLDALRAGAHASDGVIHLAFIHDFSNYEESVRVDERAIETLGAALEGSGRPLLIASGVLGLPGGRPATENDVPTSGPARMRSANLTLSLADRSVRSSVVRLPPTVHDQGDHGFIATLVGVARTTGVSGYVGDGSNRWPAVHRLDAAHLFRLVLEHAQAGSVVHAVADEGVPTRAIAEVIGRRLDLQAVSIHPEDAPQHFGWIGPIFAIDAPASSVLTRERFGWKPTHAGLLEDLEQGHYFTQPVG